MVPTRKAAGMWTVLLSVLVLVFCGDVADTKSMDTMKHFKDTLEESQDSWHGQDIVAMAQYGMGMSEPEEAPKEWQGPGMMQRGMVTAGSAQYSMGRIASILMCLIVLVIGASGASTGSGSKSASMPWTTGSTFGLQRSVKVQKAPLDEGRRPAPGGSLLGFQRGMQLSRKAFEAEPDPDEQDWTEDKATSQATESPAGGSSLLGLQRGMRLRKDFVRDDDAVDGTVLNFQRGTQLQKVVLPPDSDDEHN